MFCFSFSLTNTFLFWLKTPVRHFNKGDGKMTSKARKLSVDRTLHVTWRKEVKKKLEGVWRFHNP